MIFYWVRDRIRQNHFHIFWEEGNKFLSISLLLASMIPKLTHNRLVGFQYRSIGKGIIRCWNYQSQGNPESG